MSAEITHLVKVKYNKHGDIFPIDYTHCPLYKRHLVETSCWLADRNAHCKGIPPGNALKRIRKGEETCLLQCSYLITVPLEKSKVD